VLCNFQCSDDVDILTGLLSFVKAFNISISDYADKLTLLRSHI